MWNQITKKLAGAVPDRLMLAVLAGEAALVAAFVLTASVLVR